MVLKPAEEHRTNSILSTAGHCPYQFPFITRVQFQAWNSRLDCSCAWTIPHKVFISTWSATNQTPARLSQGILADVPGTVSLTFPRYLVQSWPARRHISSRSIETISASHASLQDGVGYCCRRVVARRSLRDLQLFGSSGPAVELGADLLLKLASMGFRDFSMVGPG